MPLTGRIPLAFHKMFASWLRIEPRCRSDDFSRGLEARTADPLWMLTRQWQLGEFKAEDAGSPVQVDLTHKTEKLDEVALGCRPEGIPLQGNPPLETLVERESVDRERWRTRIQIGQRFERLVSKHFPGQADSIIPLYRNECPIESPAGSQLVELDRATQRFLRLMAGRAVDGASLLAKHEEGKLPELPAGLDVTGDDIADFIEQYLLPWYQNLYSQPDPGQASAWQPEKLDHVFEVRTPSLDTEDGKVSLLAPNYRSGELDWYSFSVHEQPEGAWGTPESPQRFPPTRVSFSGMPHPRWWAFEDHRIDFGALDVATPDLIKLVLMEFALVYGDDWFLVPLALNIPSITRITELKVTDVFGVETLVERGTTSGDSPLQRFNMFDLSSASEPGGPGAGGFLLLPPTLGFREESPPIEEVRFRRDEVANMIWAIEHTVPNGLGIPVDGFDAQMERGAREREIVEAVVAALRGVAPLQTGDDIVSSGIVAGVSFAKAGEVVLTLVFEKSESEDARAALRLAAKQAALSVDGVESVQVELGIPQGAEEEDSGLPKYRLSTTVPANWIPFLPADSRIVYAPDPDPGRSSVKLWRGQMLRNEEDEEPVEIEGMTRLLDPNAEGAVRWIQEEAVTRAGVRVQRTVQRVRWVNGETYVWIGRKVVTGRGEGSSGLKFDYLKD